MVIALQFVRQQQRHKASATQFATKKVCNKNSAITTHIPAGNRSVKQRQVFWLVRCRAFPISKISGKECVQHSSFQCACDYERIRRQGWDLQQLVLSRILTEFPFHRLWCCNHARLLMHCKYRDNFNTDNKSTDIFITCRDSETIVFYKKQKNYA